MFELFAGNVIAVSISFRTMVLYPFHLIRWCRQAKKDMDQLLERNKKKKKRSEGEKNAQKRSPKHQHAVSTALDRKPLPGIKRQSLHSSDTWTSEEVKVKVKAKPIEENARSSRTQLNSLVSHRLSQHLSESAGTDDHEMASQAVSHTDVHNEESFRNGSLRHSADLGAPHSGEDNETREDMKTGAMGAINVKSQHEDALKVSDQCATKISLRAIPYLMCSISLSV